MFEFKLPDLGEGVHEGQIVNLLVKEGDAIEEFQPMMEVETDKAAVEIPAPKAGQVKKIHVEAGQTVKVGDVLISIEEGGGEGGEAESEQAARKEEEVGEEGEAEEARPAAKAEPKAARRAAPRREAEPEEEGASVEGDAEAAEPVEAAAPGGRRPAAARRGNGPVAAAPAVRKLARELDVDINEVPGSGPGGRVLREDVERFAKGGTPGGRVATPLVDGELPDFSKHGPIRREKVSQIRKTIARQMTRAWLSIPRVTHTDEADVTDLERNRKDYNATLAEGEPKLTLTAIILRSIAAALRAFPAMNASYDPNTDEIVYKDYVHLGIAVDTPRGLVVPVLRDADQKPLDELSQELHQIGENARNAKFEIKDLRGATFTITNYGAVGGIHGTPMVNFPECGILGIGRAKWKPAVVDGEIKPRLILTLSLSFDHRIVDGADAARFANHVIRGLENPLRLLA